MCALPCYPHDGLVQVLAGHRSEEGRPAEAEDASVGGDLVVANPWSRRHAHDGLVQVLAGHRSEEGRPEAEDASVGHDFVVAASWGRRHPYDGLVQVLAGHRTQKSSIAEAEDASVGTHQVVAQAVSSIECMPTIGADPDDRPVIEP